MCCWEGQLQQWMPGRIVKVDEADVLVHWTDPSGQTHDDAFAADDSRIRHRRVSYSHDSAQVYAVPAHCEYYGVHPSFFSFDVQGSKVANGAAINRGALEWVSVRNKCVAQRFRPIAQEEVIQLVQEGVPSPSADEEEEVVRPNPQASSQTFPERLQQAMHPCPPVQAPGLTDMVPTPLRSIVYTRMAPSP